MRWSAVISAFSFAGLAAGADPPVAGQESPRSHVNWHLRGQFAGFQGLLSIGGGPSFFRGVYRPALMYGYAPATIGRSGVHQVILRNDIVFRPAPRMKTWWVSPTASLNVLLEVGDHSLLKLPEYYPKDYYITPMIHGTFGLGVKVNRRVGGLFKEISFHMEAVALDTYLWYTLSQRNAPIHKAFGLSLAAAAAF